MRIPCAYIKSIHSEKQFPQFEQPFVTLVGRSNSGKSSFINALFENKTLVRVSNQPGRTQAVHILSVNEQALVLDLPGHGFNKAPRAIQKSWPSLIERCFQDPCHALSLYILDIRRDLDDSDWLLLNHLNEIVPFWLILTKSDKLSRNQMMQRKFHFQKELKDLSNLKNIFCLSNTKKTGIEPVQEELNSWMSGNSGHS